MRETVSRRGGKASGSLPLYAPRRRSRYQENADGVSGIEAGEKKSPRRQPCTADRAKNYNVKSEHGYLPKSPGD